MIVSLQIEAIMDANELTQEQYIAALHRFKQAICNGEPLRYFDDNSLGDKDTQCSWGLCCSAAKMWPDPETHLFKERLVGGDVAVKYRGDNQHCPMDRGPQEPWGCFYRCRIFSPNTGENVPTRKEALALYQVTISAITSATSAKE